MTPNKMSKALGTGAIGAALPEIGCLGCRLRLGARMRSSEISMWLGATGWLGVAIQIWQYSEACMLCPSMASAPQGPS